MGGFAWVTLATNDSYSLGALVLAHSLRNSNTLHKLVVLITPSVSLNMRNQLQTVFDLVKLIEVLDSKDETHLALLNRPELGITFTKIHCWKLTEFEKCVFLDADTLVVRNCDDLFEREELSAAPDVGWPDCFNSGVFVFRPSPETFDKLLHCAIEQGSYDGADQGLLNQFFTDWAKDISKHLPFVYNLPSIAAYSYYPAFKKFGSETRIVHFIGNGKPWLQKLNPLTKAIDAIPGAPFLTPFFQKWWDVFCENVHPTLDKNLDRLKGLPQLQTPSACSNNLTFVVNIEKPEKCFLTEPLAPKGEKDELRPFDFPHRFFDAESRSKAFLNFDFVEPSIFFSKTTNVPEEKPVEENYKIMENGEIMEHFRKSSLNNVEELESKQEKEKNLEKQQPSKDPFLGDTFFPSEINVDQYLRQNLKTYLTVHEHFEGNALACSKENVEGGECETCADGACDRGPQKNNLNLPRFLSIPQDDPRQSGNEVAGKNWEKEGTDRSSFSEEHKKNVEHFAKDLQKELDVTICEKDKNGGNKNLQESESVPILDLTKIGKILKTSAWKPPTEAIDRTVKKYSVPRLKPILPKRNSVPKSIITSKITLYTEFIMSSDYREPPDLPKDKIGFVEAQIVQKAKPKRKKLENATNSKFGPLFFEKETEKNTNRYLEAPKSDEILQELFDLKFCKRQLGNKPKEGNEKRKVGCFLPKSLKGKKGKWSKFISIENEKETKRKKRKTDGLFSSSSNNNRKREEYKADNVEDILKRLKDFSKNYLHYFGGGNRDVKSVFPNDKNLDKSIPVLPEKTATKESEPDRRNIGA